MGWIRSFLMPVVGSDFAHSSDALMMFIVALNVIFFVLITVLTVVFVWRYRRSRRAGPTPHMTHNTRLEIVWSVIPALVLLGLFFWGLNIYVAAGVAPQDALEITVSAKKWLWSFEYPNGTRTINEIHVPVNRPVKLVMTSEDVIHSFFLPTMRIKQDVVPGRYTEMWFTPTQTGMHQVFCAEYCGKSHSDMLAKVWVDTDAQYQKWQEEGDEQTRTMPLKDLGKVIWENRGCATCHSIDGTRGQGPSFKGIWGKQEKLADGKTALVDANYIRESITNPQAKIVAGYEPIMPTFQGLLREREVLAVIEYIKSLQ